MSPRSHRAIALSAALLTLSVAGVADAQATRGSQIEQRVLNQVGNALIQQGGGQYGAPGQYRAPGQYGAPNNAYSPYNAGPYNNQPYRAPYGQPYTNPNGYPQNGYANPGYYPGRQQQSFYQQPRQGGVIQAGGQRYQVPAQYAQYPAGSIINYGGANYVVGGDGTMTPSAGANAAAMQPAPPAPVQRYQIPGQYAGTAPGQVINYGGTNYLINNDGTMSPH